MKQATMERQAGWYWVRIEGCAWEPALWMDGMWRDAKKGSLNDNFWAEIGPRIPTPDDPHGRWVPADNAKRCLEAMKELLEGYGYVDFTSEEEREADPAVIKARAVIAEMADKAGREW